MKERPILFSGPMVRAILDGRKTQTRRAVKLNQAGRVQCGKRQWHPDVPNVVLGCPYGQPGDRLWVREAWRIGAWDEDAGSVCIDFRADNFADKRWRNVPCYDWFNNQWLRISDELHHKGIQPDESGKYKWPAGEAPLNWRPSIHMPRWASRITLEITDVRVERLNDISEDDCWAEGIEAVDGQLDDLSILLMAKQMGRSFEDAAPSFAVLWESINGAESWGANPWVWVVSFKRIAPP